MPIPRSLLAPTRPTDLDLRLTAGEWPARLTGELVLTAPHPDTLGGPHPFFGEGVVYRLSLEPGTHGADDSTFAWRHRRIDSPSARLRHARPDVFEATMIGVRSPFGFVNAANTAPLPWGDRLFTTWDVGRPVEIDAASLSFLGEVGHRDDWHDFEVAPQPLLPLVMSTAHPVIDPERTVMWTTNQVWGQLWIVCWDGHGPIRSWPIEGALIPQSVHTITQTRDWIIVGDCAFKVEPQVLIGGERTEPTNLDAPVYLIRKDALEATPPGTPVPCQRFEIAPEINHYYATWDDADGIAVLFEHTESSDLSLVSRADDLDGLGRPLDPALVGLYGLPMAPDRTTLVVFDPTTGAIVHRAEQREPRRLWGRQLNAMDWSTEGREAPTVHHTVHHGFRPEGITQRELALYGDRVDRTLWPDDETPPLVVTSSFPDLAVIAEWQLGLDDMPTSPIFVPRDPGTSGSRYAGSEPGGHDGWVVVPVLNDAGFRVEVFDAAAVDRGPVATLSAGDVTVPFVLHSAWMPRAVAAPTDVDRVRFSDELARLDELDADLAELAVQVARDLEEGVPLGS
ncbi:MAG TPA: carotenoid oxygenase family protein [Microthrixaceae bacterium]|nr:carotenoid oxygenase family protein [Microthrixaceae bacterium]